MSDFRFKHEQNWNMFERRKYLRTAMAFHCFSMPFLSCIQNHPVLLQVQLFNYLHPARYPIHALAPGGQNVEVLMDCAGGDQKKILNNAWAHGTMTAQWRHTHGTVVTVIALGSLRFSMPVVVFPCLYIL